MVSINRLVGSTWVALDLTAVDPIPAPTPGSDLLPMLLGTTELAYGALDSELANPSGSKPGGTNTGLSLRRSYDSTWKSSIGASKASSDVGAGRGSFISFSGPSITAINGGSYDATITAFWNSIPAGHILYCTWMHEADNNKVASSDYAAWRAASKRIHDLLAASTADRDLVKYGPLLTAGAFRNGEYLNYFGNAADYDFIGVDVYEFLRPPGSPPDPKSGGLGQERTPAYLCGDAVTLSTTTGRPLLVGEYGAHPFPDDTDSRPRRMKRFVDFFDSMNALGFVYFHSSQGESGPWWLDCFHNFTTPTDQSSTDPDSMTAFRDILAAHRKL